jgi:hypothetical protein
MSFSYSSPTLAILPSYSFYETESLTTNITTRKLIVIVNDLEFSGPLEYEHFVVSWGSSAYDAVTKELLGTHLIQYQKPKNKKWDPSTEKDFWLEHRDEKVRPALIAEHDRVERGEGCTVQEGTLFKVDWIHKMVNVFVEGNAHRLLPFFSDTAGSDNMFMNSLLGIIRHPPMHLFFGFFRDTFVTSSYSLGLTRTELGNLFSLNDHGLVSKGRFSEDKIVREFLKIPESVQPFAAATHDPVEDTKNIYYEYLIHATAAEDRDSCP